MKPTDTEQRVLIRLRNEAQRISGKEPFEKETPESLFKKLAYLHGLGHLLNIPDDPMGRARHEFKHRAQGFHKNNDELFDLVIDCLTKNGVQVG